MMQLRIFSSFFDFHIARLLSKQWKGILSAEYMKNQPFLLRHRSLLGIFYESVLFTLRSHCPLLKMFRISSCPLSPGNARKMFLYFMFIPNCMMSIWMFTLIALKIGIEPTNDSLVVSVPLVLYGLMLGILMLVMIAFTIATWRKTHDNIHVRGELVCQEMILCFGLPTLFIIYNIDRREMTPENEQYDSLFYLGYFITITLMAFTSLIVSTQWLPLQIRQNKKILQRSMRKLSDDLARQELDPEGIGLQSMILVDSAFDFLLQHLAQGNLINHFAVPCLPICPLSISDSICHCSLSDLLFHIQFAVEVTYCIGSLLHQSHGLESSLHETLMTKLTKFCDLPPSDIIFHPQATPRRMFIDLYDKYIDKSVQWSITLPFELAQSEWSIAVPTVLSQQLRMKYLRCKEKEKNTARHITVAETVNVQQHSSIVRTATSLQPLHDLNDADKEAPMSLSDTIRALESMLDPAIKRLSQSIEDLKKRDEFISWWHENEELGEEQRKKIAQAGHGMSIIAPDPMEMTRQQSDVKDWKCSACGCWNRFMYIGEKPREPKGDCTCCGPEEKNDEMDRGNEPSDGIDERVRAKWFELQDGFANDPDNKACGGFIVDSCHQVQKLWFFMECYVHYVGAPIGENEERYKIDSMYILVNTLLDSDTGMDELHKMYDHVYSFHFGRELKELYQEAFPHELPDDANAQQLESKLSNLRQRTFPMMPPQADHCRNTDCSMHRRNRRVTQPRARWDAQSSELEQAMVPCTSDIPYIGQNGVEIKDPKERQAMMDFDQWHSSFFHPIDAAHSTQSSSSIALDLMDTQSTQHKFWTDANLAKAATEEFLYHNLVESHPPSRYHQYGFGKQIEYYKETPGYANFKEELLKNNVHRITLQSWTDTLEKARRLWGCFSNKYVAAGPETDEYQRYGVKEGDSIGM